MLTLVGLRVLAVLFCLAAVAPLQGQSTSDPDDPVAVKWAIEHVEDVSKYVFDPPRTPNGLGLDILWVATARVTPAYETQPQIQFSLTKRSNGEVAAVVTYLHTPLQRQLQCLYAAHHASAASDLADLVKFDRMIVGNSARKTLTSIADGFARLRSEVALKNGMIVDARAYQLWVDAGAQQVYVEMLGPSDGEGRQPIVRWIEDTWRALERTGRLRTQISKSPCSPEQSSLAEPTPKQLNR